MAVFDMVFEGGGAKGSAFVGALNALAEQGHTTRRLIGTSAGAITATLTAAGYTPNELLAVVNEKQPDGKPRFAAFMDKPAKSEFTTAQKDDSDTVRALRAVHIPLLADRALMGLLLDSPIYRQLFCFVERGGLYAGLNFVQWLTEKLVAKGLSAGETLGSFFARKRVDLTVVTSDTTTMEMLLLNHRTAPGVPLVWAVRMSMSIPFVWQEVVWQDSWGPYLGESKTGNTFVDGGMLSNFPISQLTAPNPAIMGTTTLPDALVLGLLLDGYLPIPGLPPAPPKKPSEDLKVVERVSRLIDTMMEASDNAGIETHSEAICRLPVLGVGTTEFDMSSQKLAALVNGGHAAMMNYLTQRSLLATKA